MALLCQNHLCRNSLHRRLHRVTGFYATRSPSACRPKVYGVHGGSSFPWLQHWLSSLYWRLHRSSDVVAAMVHKYHDVSLGHIILFCDLAIITSSYVVLKDWEKVLYSYVLLFVISFVVDHLVNSLRQSVQFFIISDKYQEIGEAINEIADRGCSILNGSGFFTKKDIKVIFCIAKRSESSFIFELINEIDPNAFVAQSAVVGVYGQGFDRVKNHRKLNLKELKERVANENSASQQ